MTILLFADWYAPGFKAGGPIRSCVNFADNIKKAYDLYIFTSDRDLGATEPYEGITTGEWIRQNGVSLYYCPPTQLTWSNIGQQLRRLRPDFVYLNSMFSLKFTILPLLLARRRCPEAKIILSPRGMLRDSALAFKPAKKKFFLTLLRRLGIASRIHFLASDPTEAEDVRRHFGPSTQVTMIPNFPATLPPTPAITAKTPGDLSMICVGRIHPIKNTDYLLEVLAAVKARVRLTIVGSAEDKAFWQSCRDRIASLPANITVEYPGELPNDQLPAIIARHHIFALPTRGENFGHAIFEALIMGKPVLISDQTPWRNLQATGAGWDLPLNDPKAFGDAIEESASLDQETYAHRSKAARRFAADYLERSNPIEQYLKLFS